MKDAVWVKGYTRAELDHAQDKFDLRFPPDLIDVYLERRPARGWDWRTDERKIRDMLAWPYEGLLFDLEHAGLWWPEWGERPDKAEDRAEVLRIAVGKASKLVPIYGHRFIPSEPQKAGNPVFSVYQSDIYYGANLDDYWEHEFYGRKELGSPIRRIRFWSDLVDRAFLPEFYPFKPSA